MAEPKSIMQIITGVILTAVISWLGWLTILNIETDRTQEFVLGKLESLENKDRELLNQINLLPSQVNDDDRWHRSEQNIYQQGISIHHESVLFRIQRLEKFHPPESYRRKTK